MSVEIKLSGGLAAIVDDCDAPELLKHKWQPRWNEPSKTYYAGRTAIIEGKRTSIIMHRVILGITNGKLHVDHKNHDGLDNRRENLRVCTPSQNHANRKYVRGKSKYKGVFRNERCTKKWFAQIVCNKRQQYLGAFSSEIEAARAYNTAATEMFGEFAFLNPVSTEGACT